MSLTWLIAEDEADIRNLVALMCEAWGHIPLTFENGQKVWDWLDTVEQGKQPQLPELILMDIRMPGKKGNELAHRMRTLTSLQGTPIVLMTAYTLNDSERQEMMSQDGVDLILSKPLPDFDHLRSILHNVGNKKQPERVAPVSAEKPPAATAAVAKPTANTAEVKQPDTAEDRKPASVGAAKQPDNLGDGKQATS